MLGRIFLCTFCAERSILKQTPFLVSRFWQSLLNRFLADSLDPHAIIPYGMTGASGHETL
jgi:hypothetical protein